MKQRVRELYAEIRETSRYLASVEKSFDGLYRCDVEQLKLAVDRVLVDLPNAQSFAGRSFDRRYATKLILTCMNQLAISCVGYLTEGNATVFWRAPKDRMARRLGECIALREHVINCFNRVASRLLAEGRAPFCISYDTSTGLFVAFIERLVKVKPLLFLTLKHRLVIRGVFRNLTPPIEAGVVMQNGYFIF